MIVIQYLENHTNEKLVKTTLNLRHTTEEIHMIQG